MTGIPLVLSVLVVVVAPALLIRSLAAVVSTFIGFHFDLLGLSCVVLLIFCLTNILLFISGSAGAIFHLDLDFDF